MISVISRSEEETRRMGENVAKLLKGGEVIALSGNLGSGKTTFVKGLARGFGIRKAITSPTYILFRPYKLRRGRVFYHFDLYRLKSVRELSELGLHEILENGKNIVAIEWPQKAKKFLPKGTIHIRFTHGKKPNERLVTIWSKK
ncbi:MAG: tRNA (adenosine(37)-N6)-threonylcarbamoyltransferase complex ATPase subunit type 1 TsaE [Candidatus Doudnabacteria bacterium]|nr:tRNA (adenosine(37)-N6)-threonylcarbamoyltransferase complex ATPase subunit type 1 TsaE [bacterium]MDZ4243944.1 tRNA (adenosine(37)-N6)-threonylcarbamoyltransferase complex ATPase subunit type 1 TsaE [Candidatus Doudnabacteria bacterium]